MGPVVVNGAYTARMSAIEERSELEDVAAERTVSEITEAEKVEFLQMIRQGLDRQEAANALDFKGRHFRALCSPKSPFYDEDFARAYGEAIGSLEHEQYRLERLRAEGFRRAMVDSDRLLEKHLMVYDPEWRVLREKTTDVNVRVVLQQYLRDLPADKLDQIIAMLEEGDSDEVVEGIARELPLGVEVSDAD